MKKTPVVKSRKHARQAGIEISYELLELPTAFHKAGLAGLILILDSLKSRQKLTSDEVKYEITPTRAIITFSESLLRMVMNDLYDARIVEVAARSKWPGTQPKREEWVEVEVDGKQTRTKQFIYDQVQPKGAFFDNVFDGEKEIWRKLWRDMLWNIPRSRPMTREPYNQCATEGCCKEGLTAWAELMKVQDCRTKNKFYTSALSSALFPGAQAINAEGVPFVGRAEQNLLLHFWPLTVLIFVPQALESDGTMDFRGYTLAIPDVSNLTEFISEYPKLLASLSKDAKGYRPAQAVIDLPAEGALAFLEDLASIAKLHVEKGEWRSSVTHVEYLHLVKEGNNVKLMAAGRISPVPKLLELYRAIVRPHDESVKYRNTLFRRGLLVALFDDDEWFKPFEQAFALFDGQLFVRRARTSDDERGPPQFANDAAKKLRHETKLFTQKLERHKNMPDTPSVTTPSSVIVNRVVRSYLLSRTKEKTGIDPEDYKTPDGEVDHKSVPLEFNEAKQKLALSLFLEFRSRRDQAFTDHFAATFFSVTQRLTGSDRVELANLLTVPERRDDLKTLTLLSLSANS